MKKTIWVLMLVISLLVANTGVAWAGAAIELISVSNNGGGPTFTFRVSGEFSPSQLKGSGHINGGDDFEMECNQQDDTTVVCHAPKKASGQAVSVTFGGATFWADVPQPQFGGRGSSQYCYDFWANKMADSVTILGYDAEGDPVVVLSTNVVALGWQNYGPICMDEPAVAFPANGFSYEFVTSGGKTAMGVYMETPSCAEYYGPDFYGILC